MKRALSCLLVLIVLFSCAAFAEEAAPAGFWQDTGDAHLFTLEADYLLSDAQVAAFDAQWPDVLANGPLLPAGTLLTEGQANALGAFFAAAPKQAAIERFQLDGEWYYGDDGVLYYNPGEGCAIMTVDEVFAALNGETAQGAENTERKKVYFSFDDSPSRYTMELLAELDRLDIRATFFVVGAYVKKYPVFLRAIYDQGHVIGNHSYSHDQTILKESVSSAIADFKKCQNRVNAALGFDYPMTVARVPYGSSTLSAEARRQLQKLGYLWIDWNALNGDAEKGIDSYEESYDYAIRTAERCSGDVVMLMHDGKKRTIEMLGELAEYFRENGYEFAVITTDITEKIDGVRMGFPIQ